MRPTKQSAHWMYSPLFMLYSGIALAVISSLSLGIEIPSLARILHQHEAALADQYRLTAFAATIFGINATFGVRMILRAVRQMRSGD